MLLRMLVFDGVIGGAARVKAYRERDTASDSTAIFDLKCNDTFY